MRRQNALWFSVGVGLTASLSLGYGAAHYVPAAIAFGLLCFGCGVVLMQFFSLRKQEELSANAMAKSMEEWLDELKELNEERRVCGEEKTKLDEEWETLDATRKSWEAEKELAINKEVLRLLEREAVRRGGKQIDRDMNSN